MPDAKQRRATVSGGSPTFERNSLMVEDPVIRTKSQVNKGDREAALAILAASENNLKGRVPEGGVEEGGTKKTDSVWRKTSSESSSGQKGPSESEMEDSVFSSDKEDKEHQKPEKLVAEKKRQEFRVTKPTPMLMEPTSAVMASPQKTPSRKNSSSSSSSVSSSTSTSTIINSPDSVTKVKANSDSKLVPKIPKTKVLEAALKWGDQSGVVFRRKPSAPKSFVPLGRKTAVSCMDPSQSSGTNSKNAKWDCDKTSMSVTYNKQLIESQHSNEKSDVSQDREKKLFLSGESEKVTVVSKQCMEKTDVSQHCEKNTKNGNGFRDCSEQIIEIQDCEKTVTVPLDCEKTVTVPRDSEKTVTVPRDSEKTVTVPGDCEKPVTIPQDCEGKTVLSLNCENRLNGSENCEQTVSAKCCIVKPIPSETEVRKTSVTASSLLPSNTSPLFSKEDSKSPSFMTGALEFPYSTAVTDKDLEETSANIQSYTENSNMEKNNQDSLDHASHCADSPRPVLDLTHSAEQKCAVPAPGAAHSECRPQIPQQQAIHTEVATESTYDKDTPQLLKIVNTNGESEPSKQKKRVEFSSEAKSSAPSEEVSYTHIVVGGIVQKIPTERVQASGRVSPPVKMRQKNIRKHLDRRVSCKDLGKGDCEGWLYKRKEKDRSLSKNWSKRWCVLKNYNMYCYKHKEDLKAEGVIYLPAFLVSPAPSLKTKKFAFKVHNSGTTFYFASERQEDMGKWMNKMGLAAISFESSTTSTTNSLKKLQVHSHQQDGGYSESDEDPEDSNGNKEGSLKSAFSSGSVHSPQSSPPDHKRQALTDQSCPMVPLDPPVSASLPSTSQCQEQATAYHAPSDGQTYQAKCEQDVSPQKEDEFQETLITLRRHDLTIDGVDQYKRRTHHLSSILGGNDGKKSVHVAQMRKLLALKRTLKTKEQELLDIDRLLASQPSSGRIQDFIGQHPQFK